MLLHVCFVLFLRNSTMVNSCAAYNCTNRWGTIKEDGNKLQFHKFPLQNPEILKKWVCATKRESFTPTKFSFLCGRHFEPEAYKSSAQRYLKDDAIPTIFDFPRHLQKNRNSRRTIEKHSLPNKNYEREPEMANTKPQYVELQPNTLLKPVVQLALIVEPDPKSFRTVKNPPARVSETGPSSQMEPYSFMMELDQAMTCDIYPAHNPPPDTLPNIKNEPVDPDLCRQDNLSASVVQEVSSVSVESGKKDGSLFQPPALIKDEAVSSEEEL